MTYFIGLDVSKYKHDCFIMDENGNVIKGSLSFDNDAIGFNTLLNELQKLDPKIEKRIGLESTGHYGSNLKRFLEANGYSFMEFNPLLVHRFFNSQSLRRTKTDKIDSSKIALYLQSREFKPNPNSSYHLECLKSLCRFRWSLVDERSLQLVRMTNILDKIFPEYKAFFDGKLDSATSLYLLENYSVPEKIARMSKASYEKMASELRHTISYVRFNKLKDLAKNTIGNQDEILELELGLTLELFKELDKRIETVESKILQEFSLMKCHIQTIKGISSLMAASILSEIVDIGKFNSPNQLQAYAGMEPSRNQSGTHDGGGRMVKHGSAHLRRYLMTAARNMLKHNSVLYDYYLKKRSEGKSYNVAITHVARRLIRIIFYLEKNDCDFSIDKMR